jgi:hypothetical protein
MAARKKRVKLTYGDLSANPGLGVVLRCDLCRHSWSAYASDYWNEEPTQEIRCAYCLEPLRLARKVVTYVSV